MDDSTKSLTAGARGETAIMRPAPHLTHLPRNESRPAPRRPRCVALAWAAPDRSAARPGRLALSALLLLVAVAFAVPAQAQTTPVITIAAGGTFDDPGDGTNSNVTTGSSVTEGQAAGFTLSRTGSTTAALTVNVSVTETGRVVFRPPSSVTFAVGASTATLIVRTTFNSFDAADSVVTATVTASTASTATYTVGTPASATVTVLDDDTRGVTVSPTALTLTEGATGTYTVVLDSAPTVLSDPILIPHVEVRPSSSNRAVAFSPAMLQFTASNWATAQTVTVTTAQDVDAADDSATISHAVRSLNRRTDYESVMAADVTVTVTDDDTNLPVVTIEPWGDPPTEGINAAFRVSRGVPRTGSWREALTVQLRFTETGAMLGTVPTSVTIPWRGSYGHFEVPTLDDTVEETDSVVTATVIADTASPYRVETPSFAMWTVLDNDGPGDTQPPLLTRATANGSTLILTYDEMLDSASVPATGDFVVTADGSAITVTGVSITGSTVTLALATAVEANQAVTLAYTPGANPIQDAAGNDAAALSRQTVTNNTAGTTDVTPPTLSRATVNGSTLVLTYDEMLDGGSTPATGDFGVTADGSAITVTGVSVAGSTVTLTLATAVEANQAVTLAYTPGANPIQDAAGNDAVALSGQTVTNNTSAQTRQILVSNSDSSVNSNDNDSYAAQGFVTGSSSYGYTVSEVRIRFGLDLETATTAVKIRQNNNGRPGALVATLTNPNSFANDSFNTFTAPADTHLDPNTKYFFTINEGVADLGRIYYSVTTNNAESGLTGWSVDDDRLWRSSEGATSWNTSPASLIFEIRGTTVSPPPPPPPPPPPTGGGGGSGGGGGTRGPSQTVPGAPTNLLADGGDEQVTLSWQAPENDGGLAIIDYEVRINGRGSWISMGSTQTTHTVTGLVNGTVYVFQVRAVNGIGRSPASGPAEATPGVGALDFAHFADGADIVSDLVFVNVATHPIRPVLYFYDQEGQPMDPESVVDLTEDLVVTGDGGLSIRTEMEPLGELTVSTHGRGELVSGSVAVAANGPIGGVLRFDLPDIGVAGVGASPPVRDAIFPARRQAGGIRTAAALHNLGEEAITVSCRLMSGGIVLEAVEIDLEANGQAARYIEELFTATDTSDFVGSVRCTAPGLFTGIAVELDEGNRIFTTLPVVPVARAGGRGQETVLYFAHFANGSGTTSDLVFVNVSPRPSGPGPTPFHATISPSRPALYFYDQEGHLMDPESVVDLTEDLEVTGDGGLSIQTEMEPLGELTISTHGRGELVSGSVKVVSEGPIGGVLRYALPGIGVTGVGASQPVRDALFPVRQEGGLDTAAAIRNLTESDLVVTCRLMKDGAVLEETQIPLAANGQEARYIEEMFTFTGADVSDFVGSVRCTVPPRGRGCSPEWPWSWMRVTASSPHCRWCRSRERRILRNRRGECPDGPGLASGDIP